MFKVNNKNIRTPSMTWSIVFIVNFEHIPRFHGGIEMDHWAKMDSLKRSMIKSSVIR